jgi:hypothetical protein
MSERNENPMKQTHYSSAEPAPRKRFNKKQIFFIAFLQIFLLVGLFALGWYLGILGNRPSFVKQLKDGDIADVTSDEIDNLYDTMVVMAARLDECGVDYWLLGGSLIGAMRNIPPGPMKWDDDHDVGMNISLLIFSRSV